MVAISWDSTIFSDEPNVILIGIITVMYLGCFIILELSIVLTALWYERELSSLTAKDPFFDETVWSPGYVLRKKLKSLWIGHMKWMIYAYIFFTCLIFMFYQAVFEGQRMSFVILAAITFLFLLLAEFTRRLIYFIRLHRRYKFNLNALLTTAKHLQDVIRQGAYVYHDIPMWRERSIDHVIVSEYGVFAVSTFARKKYFVRSQNSNATMTINYNGSELKFPFVTIKRPIKRAVFQSAWLSKSLSDAIGKDVEVKPIVSLPGWNVIPIANLIYQCACVNPKNISYYLKEKVLSKAEVELACKQVKELCREVRLADSCNASPKTPQELAINNA